jgi:hypothetical protein
LQIYNLEDPLSFKTNHKLEEKIETEKMVLLRKLNMFLVTFNFVFSIINFRENIEQKKGFVYAYYFVQYLVLGCSYFVKLKAIIISNFLMQLFGFYLLFLNSGVLVAEKEEDKMK